MDKTLTISEIAKQLQVSSSLIYKYTESGKIPSVKIGNRTRIFENELNKYLQSTKERMKNNP